MSKKRILVISPSGSFYGSEQVLYDYLTNTAVVTDVAVPANSVLYEKLVEKKGSYNIKTFKPFRLPQFFLGVARDLFFNRYQSVYLNEAGPVKYVMLLAKLFRKKRFVIHVRIVEDTVKERWLTRPPKNVTVISISKYIREKLYFETTHLYDPFPFEESAKVNTINKTGSLTIGVIGRITYSKGLADLIKLLDLIKERGLSDQFRFILFGTVSEDAKQDNMEARLNEYGNVTLAGFISSKAKLYDSIDGVLHLSSEEPLGRIFLEAIDTAKPFIGINSGGIGEIASLLGIEHQMADPAKGDLAAQLLQLLEQVKNNYQEQYSSMVKIKGKAKEVFDLNTYVESVDKLLLS